MEESKLIGYHATSEKKFRKIIANGFNPVKYAYQHPNPKIRRAYWTWFTEEPNFQYGQICIKVDLTGLNCVINKGCCIICKELHIPKERILGRVNYKDLEKIDVFDRDIIRDTMFNN